MRERERHTNFERERLKEGYREILREKEKENETIKYLDTLRNERYPKETERQGESGRHSKSQTL